VKGKYIAFERNLARGSFPMAGGCVTNPLRLRELRTLARSRGENLRSWDLCRKRGEAVLWGKKHTTEVQVKGALGRRSCD